MTTTMDAPIYCIDPNPWQIRQAEDPDHIGKLSADIRENGLLQRPLARVHPHYSDRYQLAFGHSRLSACKQLGWAEMPIEVRELNDRQMSDLAASENAARKNLSAIETAEAIARRIQDFGLNQLEAGRPFGYSHPASVSNLLRLLKLPQEIRDEVHAGRLPERLARQATRMAMLWPKETTSAIKSALGRPSPNGIENDFTEQLNYLLREKAIHLNKAGFELDWPAQPISLNGHSTETLSELKACGSCEHKVRDMEGYQNFCLMPECFALKERYHDQAKLDDACKRFKLPASTKDEVQPVVHKMDWKTGDVVSPMLKLSAKAKTDLGLSIYLETEHKYEWINILGYGLLRLGTSRPSEVKAWLEAKAQGKTAASKAEGVTPEEKAESKKAAEEERLEAARAERASKMKLEADLVWLVSNTAAIIADELDASGITLRYLVEHNLLKSYGNALQVYGLKDWWDKLEAEAEAHWREPGNDVLNGQLWAAYEIFRRLPFQMDWQQTCDEIEDLCSHTTGDDGVGFGVRLPIGWDHPPVHKTPGNCWECGDFTGQRGRLTKGDIERGWTVEGDPESPTRVLCPDCHGTRRVETELGRIICPMCKVQP